ncbi:hypothetical protein FACS18942_10380 [Planctomycetales bacterium]|nr:hypothetical protein FACS18942_10380 [Planctomycetales bacterium]GHT35005.1 hypothetical protein FACS189427_03410 [Planctomycetales bacterium]
MNTSRTSQYLNLANEFSQLIDQMRYADFALSICPQVIVGKSGNLQIRFQLLLSDSLTKQSVNLTDNNNNVSVDVNVVELLEWAAALQHKHRPADNSTFILDGEENILGETVGELLAQAGSPVGEAIRNWWKNFTAKESGYVETLS